MRRARGLGRGDRAEGVPAEALACAPLAEQTLVIGHRGASALRPEHTLESYRKAIEDGADAIEPDLVCTRDGVLVARHESELSSTTNVAALARFADRRTRRCIDGELVAGWFVEDFTLAEIKELRARERMPAMRPASARLDDRYEVPTLAEVIALARAGSAHAGRAIGLYPETKHPTYFRRIGLALEARLIDALRADAFTASETSVWIQCFEAASLREIGQRVGASQPNWRIVQLLGDAPQRPWELAEAGDPRCYGDLMSAAGLREIATYADAVGPSKASILAMDGAGRWQPAGSLVRDAHAAGLLVHPYAFRPENAFLPAPLRAARAASVRHPRGAVAEIRAYLRAGVDGFFTDDPAVGRRAVDGGPSG